MEHSDLSRRPLNPMFGSVAPTYDLINRILTWGMDQGWRKRAVEICLEEHPASILDLCTGTGDMAFMLARLAPSGTVLTAADFNERMLGLAEKKLGPVPAGRMIRLALEDASSLSFAKSTFDAVTVSFAFRNLTYRNANAERHLSEILRVLKPGGRLIILESSVPENPVFRAVFNLYIRLVVAPVGQLISGDASAYRYLSSSIAGYYRAEELKELLLRAGFARVEYDHLLSGVAAIHVCRK